MNLDFTAEEFRKLLYQAADLAVEHHQNLRSRKIFHGKSPSEIRALFDEPLPNASSDLESLVTKVQRDVFSHATLNLSPNFMSYVMSGANHAGILGVLLEAGLNQNVSKWHLGASAAEMELQTIRWLAEFIGYPVDTGGIFVSGGSIANLTCLVAARKARAPFDVARVGLVSGPPLTMYVCAEGHSCLDKSLDFLGLGKNQLRKIPAQEDFTIDIEKLAAQIKKDKSDGCCPICIIGNGGAVNTGAIDSLNDLADLAQKHKLWFHVDAAYGGPAAATELMRHAFRGMERADSIALDPHKWLYAPFEAGCAFIRDKKLMYETFSVLPDYLRMDADKSDRTNFSDYGFQLSRNFKALKIWMAFKAYGADALRKAIQSNIETMRYLGNLIEESRDFELLAPVPLSAVCFRYRTKDSHAHQNETYLAQLNKKLIAEIEQDGRLFIAGTIVKGRPALRACSVNHRLERRDVEYVLAVVRELGAKLHTAQNIS